MLHISDGESSEGWVLGEGLDTHWLGWVHNNDGGLILLDELWLSLDGLSGSSVDLVNEGGEFTGDVGSVAIQDWGISSVDLTWVVHDDDLGLEGFGFLGWVFLGVGGDVSSSDILDGQSLDVETDVVSWEGLQELFVVHFDGLNISNQSDWGELDAHTWLEDSGFDSSDWDCSDTSDLVDVLEWQSEWLIEGSDWWGDGIQSLQEGGSLVPVAVGGSLDEVVTVESGEWDEWDLVWVESDLLQVGRKFLLDFFVSLLRPGDGLLVHLVGADDHLSDSQSEGQQTVLSGLSVLGDSSLELTWWGGDHEDGNIGLGGSGDHVLDEISMSWGIDDGEVVLLSLELPEGDIDGDTSFSLSLEFIQDPSVLEGGLSDISGFLFELFDGSLVDTSALVDQVSGGG